MRGLHSIVALVALALAADAAAAPPASPAARSRTPGVARENPRWKKAEQAPRSGAHGLKAGDAMPHFTLPDSRGAPVSSKDLLTRAPLVVCFFRGHW